MKKPIFLAVSVAASLMLASCGGGGGSTTSAGTGAVSDPNNSTGNGVSGACNFVISDQPQALTSVEVEKVIAQATQAAGKLGAKATISVVDRVGNVLAVYKMTGAADKVKISSGRNLPNQPQGLDGLSDTITSELAAIAKAVTGAYLSSSGNAFSTRTASFIIQEHFIPTVTQTSGGPLFGVQFSQLPCGDLVTRGAGVGAGPKRSPLGLSADAGGFPLYKNGRVVGGIGVVADGIYGLDLDPINTDTDLDERIAQSAVKDFGAPDCIRADHITAGGVSLPYSDSDKQLVTVTATKLSDADVSGTGALSLVDTYFAGTSILAGSAFGETGSGIAADSGAFKAMRGYMLVNSTDGANRYPLTASQQPSAVGNGGSGMTAAEAGEILKQALGVANQARAQIRRPVGSAAEVTISVVDAAGNVIGMVRTPDAPVFGTDVSLQKARTAAFFSSPTAASALTAQAGGNYVAGIGKPGPTSFTIDSYLSDPARGARAFFNKSNMFADGTAFSARTIGNISRPNFPDGIDGNPRGPFGKPIDAWSPFNVGLQLDLVYGSVVNAIVVPTDATKSCSGTIAGLKNGMQIFPGGFPIYRGNEVIGAVGVSGDGIDQDDMISFLGLARAAKVLNTGIGHAPLSMRADVLNAQGLRLHYAQCPQTPFNNSSEQNVCDGI